MTASSEPGAVRRALAALLTMFVVAAVVVAFQQQHRAAARAVGHINDFDRWMIMTPALVVGHADYVNDDLPTPPVSLLLFAPLASLGRPAAQLAWALLKVPVACAVFALVMGLVRRTGVVWTLEGVLLVAAGWWLAVMIDFQEGQMNLITLLPLVLGLYLVQTESPASSVAGGLLVGLAVAIKVTPIVFVAYFLWRRRFAVAAAAVAGVVLWSIAPAAAFGWEQNLTWLGQWARIMIVPYITRGTVAYATSQSIGSFMLRLLTDMSAFDSHHGGGVQEHYMNIAALAPSTVDRLVRALMVAVGVMGLWWARGRLPTLTSRRYVLEIGAVAAFMLWFSERTWVPHYVSFILTLAAAGMIVSDGEQPHRRRTLVRGALIAFAVVTPLASEAGRLLGPDGVDWAKALGVYLWPSVLVTSAVVLPTVLRRA